MPIRRNAASHAALIAGFGAVWLLALFYAQSANVVLADESVHVPQIQDFMRGSFVVHPLLTTIPGYHLLMAGAMKLLAADSVAQMRAIGAVLGLAPALVFYFIRRTTGDLHPVRSASLLFFLPFLYPYYFLIYTDVLSLALVLCAMLATLHRRHFWSAVALVFSILVRQNNVVWAGFMPLFALWPVPRHANWRPGIAGKTSFGWQGHTCSPWPFFLPTGRGTERSRYPRP